MILFEYTGRFWTQNVWLETDKVPRISYISNQEQFSITIRWVDVNFQIHKDLIGLVSLLKTDVKTTSMSIKDIKWMFLLPFLTVNPCPCLFAKARAMTVYFYYVMNQEWCRFKTSCRVTTCPARAVYVHCLAHCLINLVLQDASHQWEAIRA